MKVLITGGGLIGAYTAKQLISKGHEVIILDIEPSSQYLQAVINHPVEVIQGRVEDFDAITSLIKGSKIDTIIHTAALMKAKVQQNPWLGFNANVVGTAAMLEHARRKGVNNFIFCSSLAIYDFEQTAEVVTEEHPKSLKTLYEYTKMLAEMWLQAVTKDTSIQLSILRLSGTYGAGQYRGGAWMGKRLQDLILRIMDDKIREVEVDETEFGVNEYLYVKDVANAICLAAERTDGKVLTCNVGSGKLTSIHKIVAELEKFFPEVQIHILSVYTEEGKMPVYLKRISPLSLERTRSRLGYQPAFSDIKIGLEDYIKELSRLRGFI